MPIDYSHSALPKPEPRRRTKGRQDRREAAVQKLVRAVCVERDGGCRLRLHGACAGQLEFAHADSRRRSKTPKGLGATYRNDSAHALMLCTRHHRLYDTHLIDIEPLTDQGMNGVIAIRPRVPKTLRRPA